MGAEIKALFVSADNKEKESADVVDSLVQDSRFSADVLLATSVLDVGVNIEDDSVSVIILDTFNRTSFLQMLGRVRVKPEQDITVYIFKRNVRYFKNRKESLRPRLQFQMDMAKVSDSYLLSKIAQALLQDEFWVDKSAIYFFKGRPRLNRLILTKLQEQFDGINTTIVGLEGDEEYHIKEQLQWLGVEETFSVQHYASAEIRKERRQAVIIAIRETCQPSSKDGLSKQEVSKKLQNIKGEIRSLDIHHLRSNETLSIGRFKEIC